MSGGECFLNGIEVSLIWILDEHLEMRCSGLSLLELGNDCSCTFGLSIVHEFNESDIGVVHS